MVYPQQYPGQYDPYAGGGYAPGPAAPSGGTAITAGVLAALGAVSQLAGAAISLTTSTVFTDSGLSDSDLTSQLRTLMTVTSVVSFLVAALLGGGAVLLFLRKAAGRILVAAGCGLVIVAQLANTVLMATLFADLDDDGSVLAVAGLSAVFSLIFPIVTLVLALLPATARWLAHRPAEAGYPYGQPPMGYQQPNPYGYNPSGGYGQPPGYPPVDPFGQGPTQMLPGAAPTQRVDGFGDAATQVVGPGGAPPNPFEKPAEDQWQRPNS
ncbi:hypothetical protein AB0H76_25080 [Nocardia sp. NPDC050712]|uniref:hypothetical protein n=1 Tax=Nocardia sp. NPDC050712 TaxID=3155518 RepID=UPI0033FFA1DE